MAWLSGRWTAVLVLCAATVACIVATTRLAHSPWCDGPTLLPSVLCSLHPTRWVSKGYYPPNLFRSRKGRAGGSPASSGLTTDLDATSDFGETAGGGAGLQQPSIDIPQPKQPAVDVPDAPAEAKLDAVAEQMEAGGSQTSRADQKHAASSKDGGDEQQPEAPSQQQPDQQQEQQPDEQHQQDQQRLGEPAAEQPPKVDAGPAEQQRAEMPPEAQQEAEAAAQQDASAEEQLSGQNADNGQAQQDAPAEQQPEAQQQPQQQVKQPRDEQQPQQPQEADAEPQQEQPQQTEQQPVQQQDQQQPQAAGDSQSSPSGEQQQAEAGVRAEGRLPPVREWVGDQEVIWEKPRGRAKGVFLALNGCNHGPDGWWDPQPACPDCLGLPEEKNIVRAAIERGYVALALAVVQQRRRMRCWANLTPPNWNRDMNATVKTVKTLTEREGWTGLPLTAWGGSAGGSFAARLPYYLPMQGIMVQLKSVAGEEVQADPTNLDTGETVPYPKVVYAYNRRDPTAKERAYAYTDALQDKGIDYVLLAADPHPLAPHFFADRIEDIDGAVSQQLFDALKGGGFLDDNNYLIEDPRKSDKRWQAVLRDRVPYAKTAVLTRFISPIFEELNWAFSNHQGISDCTAASFEFFETGVRPDEKMLENPEWWELQEQAHAH